MNFLRVAALVVVAIVIFVVLDICFACFGFGPVHRFLSRSDRVGRPADEQDDYSLRAVAATRKAINIATKWYYRSGKDCLPRAVTATLLLRLQGVGASFKVGVKKYPFAGHAWVECGGIVIDDPAPVAGQYSELANGMVADRLATRITE